MVCSCRNLDESIANTKNQGALKVMIQQLQRKLDQTKVADVASAKLLCWLIPASCPFERTVTIFGHTIHIPSLCKVNPLYEQLVGLRFRALEYLESH